MSSTTDSSHSSEELAKDQPAVPAPKKREKAPKQKAEKIEDEDENLRSYKAITEMVKKLIEAVEKGEKLDFMMVRTLLRIDKKELLCQVQAAHST